MEIVFVANQCLPFHARSLEERPLGGTETAVIRLSEALHRLGHQVSVVTSHGDPPASQPRYLSYAACAQLKSADALVVVRDWRSVLAPVSAKLRLFWTGDSFDVSFNIGIGDRRVVERIDGLLAASHWHADALCSHSGFPYQKVWVMGNGVNLDDFQGEEVRVRKRLIYSSSPTRGLKLVPPIYQRVKERHPDAQLQIFSGYGIYGEDGRDIAQHLPETQSLFDQLRALPDCVVRGNVLQSALAREFMKSAVLLYPNTFDETSCITAMEAQAAGCVAVTSKRAALPETVDNTGIVIAGKPETACYTERFVAAVDRLLSDDRLFEKLSARGRRRAQCQLDWLLVAERLVNYLAPRLRSRL